MKRIIICFWVLGLFWFGLQLAWAETGNRIVAIVNNEIITFYELEKAKKNYKIPDVEKDKQEEFQKQLLFQLIDQKLIDLQVKKLGIQIHPEEVDRAIDKIKEEQGLNTPEKFARVLLQEGLSESEFRNKIKDQILRVKLISREIGSKIIIPEAQARDYYEKNKTKFQKMEGVQLALIFVPIPKDSPPEELEKEKKKILDIQDRLRKGENFAELARKFSKDPSAPQGGNLGKFNLGEIDPSLRNAISTLKPGDITPILQTPNGWEIVKLIDVVKSQKISYEEAKNQILDQLFHAEVDKRFTQWLQNVKDHSYIKVLL